MALATASGLTLMVGLKPSSPTSKLMKTKINPEVFRRAAEIVAADMFFCCPAIKLACTSMLRENPPWYCFFSEYLLDLKRARMERHHIEYLKDFFFADQKPDSHYIWWVEETAHMMQTTRIIALELAALLAEESQQ